jgi:hypothetical protein
MACFVGELGMAHLLPSDISHLTLASVREPELETLRQLQARLPSAYTVFHSVHWSREYKSDIKFGELDFVVVNQGGKVLVIEQKNGRLEETTNGLVKAYPERAKSVGDQVRRALDGVREKFKWVHRNRADLDLDHLIYCPPYRVVPTVYEYPGSELARDAEKGLMLLGRNYSRQLDGGGRHGGQCLQEAGGVQGDVRRPHRIAAGWCSLGAQRDIGGPHDNTTR